MNVQINQKYFNIDTFSMDELISLVEKEMELEGKVVSHYKIDGQVIYDLDELINQTTISLPNKIEVVLITKEELAVNALKSALDYLDRALPEIQFLADEFYSGSQSENWVKLGDLVDGLNWIFQVFDFVFNVNLKGDMIEKLGSNFVEIKEELPGLLEAMEQQDTVTIADIICYEIKPLLEEIKVLIKKVLESWENKNNVI